MNTQELHDGFQAELVRRGLPVEYSSGAATELADHHSDLVEELRANGFDASTAKNEAANRLGDRRQLVKKSVREFQRRHWCGRWPLLSFLIGPLVLLIATWTATILVLVAIGGVLKAAGVNPDFQDGTTNTTKYVFSLFLIVWFVFLMPAVVILFLSRRARFSGLSRWWVVLAASVLAFNVGTIQVKFAGESSKVVSRNLETGEQLAPDTFMISLPLWICFDSFRDVYDWYASSPRRICQFLLPVAFAGLLIWRHRLLAQRHGQSFRATC